MKDDDLSWKESLYRGMPALIVAGLALLLVAYGKFVLSPRLPAHYAEELSRLKQQYSTGVQGTQQLLKIGSSIDICYARLENFGVETDPWERLEFIEAYLSNLRGRQSEENPDALGEKIEEQIAKFAQMRERIVTQLAAPESEYAKEANLLLAKRLLAGGYEPDRGELLVESLQSLASQSPRDLELNCTLAQLLLERAWWQAERIGRLPPDRQVFTEISALLEGLTGNVSDEFRAKASRLQLEILVQQDALAAVQLAETTLARIAADSSLNQELQSALLSHSILGNWPEVRSLLGQKFAIASQEEQRSWRNQVAQAILRLFFSDLPTASSSWCDHCAQGLQLAVELNPTALELHALIWELVQCHAEFDSALSAELVEAIMISESNLRYLILALSSGLRDSPEKAQRYLQLATQSNPLAIPLLSNILIRQSSFAYRPGDTNVQESGLPLDPMAQSETLRDQLLTLKPLLANSISEEDAAGWIALAQLQLLAGENDQATKSAQIAKKTLGDSSIIDVILEAAKNKSRESALDTDSSNSD